ncbi:MAG: hypothetical protein IT531_00135 [Burkholderiales bacterium]|nr:hypothetical protein [Burkholderiales bacterium]
MPYSDDQPLSLPERVGASLYVICAAIGAVVIVALLALWIEHARASDQSAQAAAQQALATYCGASGCALVSRADLDAIRATLRRCAGERI